MAVLHTPMLSACCRAEPCLLCALSGVHSGRVIRDGVPLATAEGWHEGLCCWSCARLCPQGWLSLTR